MRLPSDGREYAHFGFHDLPATPPTPRAQIGTGIVDLAWWDATTDPVWLAVAARLGITAAQAVAGTDRVARTLVAGPDATDNPAGTVALPVGRTTTRAGFTDTPEVIWRDADVIDVK